MKFTLGTKQHMIQYFDENGKVHPATVVSAGPIVVTKVFTKEADGYDAVQVGYGTQKKERINKARTGQMGGFGSFRYLKELRIKKGELPKVAAGDSVALSVFAPGDKVVVTGTSKGKGFQSVIKRHGFHGGPRSHGQKHSEREPGSIGGGLRNRVPKGMRMAGRTGSDTITSKNHTIIDVDTENNQLVIKGAIPGRRGSLISVKG